MIVTPQTPQPDLVAMGGKGGNLWQLSQKGLPVPPWFVISTAVYREAIQGVRARLEALLDAMNPQAPASVRTASEAIQALIRATPIPEGHRAAIVQAREQWLKPDALLAVRSSAVGEDHALQSFAGQMDTFLHLKTTDEMLSAIQQCWASAFSERALSYRHLTGCPLSQIEVAVVVQEMIHSDVSGVMFTADPTTGDRDSLVISATWGLGEGLVSGQLDADLFVLKDGELKTQTNPKTERIVFDTLKGSGTRLEPVEPDRQNAPCLDAPMAREIANWGKTIEVQFGTPQDIEFAVHQGTFYLLQARPITTLPSGAEILWDNSNITESYSGVTTPLTFTFASQAYHVVYQQFCDMMGVPREVIQENQPVLKNMLGLIKGRVFYNLNHWYQVLSLLPGFNTNKAFMEQMMGVKKAAEFQSGGKGSDKFGLVWRMSRNFLTLDRQVDAFGQMFNHHFGRYKNKDFSELDPSQLVAAYRDLEKHLLWNWRAPLINDFFAMIFYGVLKKWTTQWNLDDTGSLQNDLLCGEGGIESTEPTKAIMRMAVMVQQDPALQTLLNQDDHSVREQLASNSRYAAFKAAFDDYLDRYGYRCMNELKLEEANLKEEPGFIFTMIRNYLGRESLDLEAMEVKEREIRNRAEAQVASKLAAHPIRKLLFGWILANARKTIKNRENMRFARTKIFGIIRELFQAMGRHFQDMGLLNDPKLIFYLNLDEIFGFVEGRSTCTDIQTLCDLRKKEFDRYRQEDVGDRFTTRGVVYFRNRFVDENPVEEVDLGPNMLKGTSCCPGTVKNRARVILSPQDDMRLNGEILVAERTDPGWVPLYPSASGILIERGSLLSHSAIVARELGIPTIIGVRNLTKRVHDGQLIEMDARQGLINLDPA